MFFERINNKQAIELYNDLPLFEIGQRANLTRQSITPGNKITYVVDRNINYTNICVSSCKFCAYYKDSNDSESFVIETDKLKDKVTELLKIGGQHVLLQGGLNPEITLFDYAKILKDIKSCGPVHIHGFSPPEIIFMSKENSMSIEEVLKFLISAGLDSIPGGGAEILSDKIREKVSPKKCSSQEWIDVMRTAHYLKLKTTATMVIGLGESIHERIEHLEKIRNLQDETNGFTAFIMWTFQPNNTELKIEKTGASEYLRMLALSRIYLDNVKNIQTSWVTQGLEIAQVSLQYGANDFGGTMMEENVVKAAGTEYSATETQVRKAIKDVGFFPQKRDVFYNYVS